MSWVAAQISEKKPQFIYVFSSAMAQYVPRDLPPETQVILDFVDVDSAKWRQYAETQSMGRRWFYGTEAKRLLAFDRAQAARAQASLFVSDDEKRIFDRLSPGDGGTSFRDRERSRSRLLRSARGGAGRSDAQDDRLCRHDGLLAEHRCRQLVCQGDFAAGAHAARRCNFSDRGGASDGGGDGTWRELKGVEVTGGVPDVRPYVAAASVVVAPLRIARGIQNKVLEGMAMARPVVTTPGALEGINAVHGRDLLVGETPGETCRSGSQRARRARHGGAWRRGTRLRGRKPRMGRRICASSTS